jgi:hypothetical protein
MYNVPVAPRARKRKKSILCGRQLGSRRKAQSKRRGPAIPSRIKANTTGFTWFSPLRAQYPSTFKGFMRKMFEDAYDKVRLLTMKATKE